MFHLFNTAVLRLNFFYRRLQTGSRMLTRVPLFLFLAVASFKTSCGERQKDMIPISKGVINLMSKAKSQNASRAEEHYAVGEKVRDCADLYKAGYNKNGTYTIWPITRYFTMKRLDVYCDMTTDGGGWTVIQRRGDFKREDNFFDMDWQRYKEGFGSIRKDFWLGNENIFYLTNQRLYSIRFDLEDKEQNRAYAEYDRFWIDDESNKYAIHISDYSGTAGNAMEHHNKMRFSTKDSHNDNNEDSNCAISYRSGWWFNSCYKVNLNGIYNNETAGIDWDLWKKDLFKSEIKIRPLSY